MTKISTHQLFSIEKIEAIKRRIAFQILESNVDEKELFLVGVASNGLLFAQRLKKNSKASHPKKFI